MIRNIITILLLITLIVIQPVNAEAQNKADFRKAGLSSIEPARRIIMDDNETSLSRYKTRRALDVRYTPDPAPHPHRDYPDDFMTYRFMVSDDGGENWSEILNTGDLGMWEGEDENRVQAFGNASYDFGTLIDLDNNLHFVAVLNRYNEDDNPLERVNGLYDVCTDDSGENVTFTLIAEQEGGEFVWSDCGIDADGNLYAIWVNVVDDNEYAEIWASKSRDGGGNWSEPFCIADELFDVNPYAHMTNQVGEYFYIIFQQYNPETGLYDQFIAKVPADLEDAVFFDSEVSSGVYYSYYVGANNPIAQDVDEGYVYFTIRNEDLSATAIVQSENEGDEWNVERIDGPQRYPSVMMFSDRFGGTPWIFSNVGFPAVNEFHHNWFSYDEIGYNGGSWLDQTQLDSVFFDGERDLLYCHQGVVTTEGRIVSGSNVWGVFTPEGFRINYTDDFGENWENVGTIWSIFDDEIIGGYVAQCHLLAGQDNTVWVAFCGKYGETDVTPPEITNITLSSVELGEPWVVSADLHDEGSGISYTDINYCVQIGDADEWQWEWMEADSAHTDQNGNGTYFYTIPSDVIAGLRLRNDDIVRFYLWAQDGIGNIAASREFLINVGDDWGPADPGEMTDVEVLFQVDMSGMIDDEEFDPDSDGVIIRGSHEAIGNWGGYRALERVEDTEVWAGWIQFDGVETGEEIEYKFVIDIDNDQDGPVLWEELVHGENRMFHATGEEVDSDENGYGEILLDQVYFSDNMPDIGEIMTVGHTWYSFQGNGTLAKQIAVDNTGGVHFTWMKSFDNRQAGRHVMYNFYESDDQGWMTEEGETVDNSDRAGYSNLAVLPADGRAVVFYHINEDSTTAMGVDWMRGIGAFSQHVAPNWDESSFIWPHGTADSNNRVHIISHITGADDGFLQYVRGNPADEEFQEWEFSDPVIIGRTDRLAYTAAASKESDRVALTWTQKITDPDDDRWNNILNNNNDLYCVESDDGENFDFEHPINITRILRPDPEVHEDDPLFQGDTLRSSLFVDACYDYDNNLHIVFSTIGFWESTDPDAENPLVASNEKMNLIWHWDRESGEIHLVADGWYDTGGGVGGFTSNLSFPSIGVDEDNNLYCVFTKFPEQGDFAANGMINGEIYATVSGDGGRSWALPTNVTNTHAPGGEPGECASESWSTLAEKVDDNLHISYIFDKDPGAAIMGEGDETENPFVYHQVPRENVNRAPVIEDRPFHVAELIPDLRHFAGFIRTDISHSLLIQELVYHGEPVPTGWEIGVYTPDDILAGGGVWVDGERLGMGAWGDEAETEEIVEGFITGQSFRFRVWDDETDQEYSAAATFVHGPETWQLNGISVLSLDASRELTVNLEEGWTMMSINVNPPEEYWEDERGPDVILMTEQMRIDEENHRMIIIKDGWGRFYLPDWDFINIPYWDLSYGYMIKMNEGFDAVWSGSPIPYDSDIPLEEGWNMVAYFPTYELDADAPEYYVLSNIIDHVIIAKDGNGDFMLPAWEFSNMPPWRETQGYMIKTDEEVVLNYPEEQQELACASLPPAPRGGIKGGAKNTHWQTPSPTGRNMSVLIKSIQNPKFNIQNSQIAAFDTDGQIVGVSQFDTDGRCGLAVWGDDPSTEVKDGLIDGEAFTLRLLKAQSDDVFDLETGTILAGDGPLYKTDSYTVLDLLVSNSLPTKFYLADAYPNPFNHTTRLNYGLPEAAQVKITVYDIAGRTVDVLIDREKNAGIHTLVWDASKTSAGIYFIRMETDGFKSVGKAVLMK